MASCETTRKLSKMLRRRPPAQAQTQAQAQQSSPSRPDNEEREQTQHSLLSVSTNTTTSNLDSTSAIQFYNTTFSSHRVSDLHGITLHDLKQTEVLERLAKRIRNKLVGDVVRGVEISAADNDNNTVGSIGVLEGVEVRLIKVGEFLGIDLEEEDEEKECLVIVLRYENAEGWGVLLPGNKEAMRVEERFKFGVGVEVGEEMDIDSEEKGIKMPLLLLRMPVGLKGSLTGFLEEEFDCRVSGVRLGSKSIVGCLEGWIKGDEGKGGGKDVVVSIGFHTGGVVGGEEEGLGLKSLDVIIPGGEVKKFERVGRRLDKKSGGGGGWEGDLKRRRELAGRLREEGWEWREEEEKQQPFIEALGVYLREHTGLDLFHPAVRIVKVACGGFVIAEGRVKIFKPVGGEEQRRRVGWEILRGIIEEVEVMS
ncbi:kinetochore complex Sim4 subunit Fta1-domain-containing protein [Podospora fimiseda]|uniref:Kinetochore complex Sim4 subunit Fta1-domain-containing protein n=1 Tax=Podospora fimiseda TaxID=252190 RepID=A0AAN7BL39_9PEZI|nr:kinetochore complex Sim4 subunit Fta1-domain-containing protein [Podospora fimiseda]